MDKATQSKERLSDALLELLKTVPYEDITVQRISDHAGVSRMAFYRNFDSKDDVIRYYLEKYGDTGQARVADWRIVKLIEGGE